MSERSTQPPKPSMPKWQIYLLVVFGSVVAIVLLHAGLTMVNAFSSGSFVMSPPTVTALTLMLLGTMQIINQFVQAWFQKKTSDLNNQKTQQVVHEAKEEIKHSMKNGGGDAIASKVVEKLQPPRDPESHTRSGDTESPL